MVPCSEIDQVIAYIHRHLFDPMPLARLARHISYSPSHFARLFKERTGLTPLYYVSSIRLERSKDMLLRTHLSVRDIGLEIRQQSLGTFTTRFTQRVGVSPAEFRQSIRSADRDFESLRRLREWEQPAAPIFREGCVSGTIEAAVPFEGFVLIGLFSKPIPEGLPLYGTLVRYPGSFRFDGVKPGIYYLMATSISWTMGRMDMLLPKTTLRTRSKSPLAVLPGVPLPPQEVLLQEPRLDDPPILVSLPLLMNNFLSKVRQGL
ncbi:helix-turn-helix domain-containing protein [Paenibacillus sp. D51F]